MEQVMPRPLRENGTPAGAPHIRVRRAGRMALGQVVGPLDVVNADELRDRLKPLGAVCSRVVLDLRRAEFIDSAGVRVLLQLHEQMAARQSELRLVLPPEGKVRRTLALLQLLDHFHHFESVVAAWIQQSARP